MQRSRERVFGVVLFFSWASGGCAADTRDVGASDAPVRPGGGDAGALPRADASAAADASDGEVGSARCFPNDPNPGYGLACRVDAEMCVHDYAGISSFPRPSSCQPLTDACKDDRTCACVTKHFRCGITTSCTVLPSGLVLVVCQPD